MQRDEWLVNFASLQNYFGMLQKLRVEAVDPEKVCLNFLRGEDEHYNINNLVVSLFWNLWPFFFFPRVVIDFLHLRNSLPSSSTSLRGIEIWPSGIWTGKRLNTVSDSRMRSPGLFWPRVDMSIFWRVNLLPNLQSKTSYSINPPPTTTMRVLTPW